MRANIKDFAKSAQGLSKNPLGIIALFTVLIYGFGCIVVAFAGEKLANVEHHPLVWFLAVFPFVVLFTFTFLVAKHHKKLYGPSDYDDTQQFLSTFDENDIPESLLDKDTGIATSDTSTLNEINSSSDLVSELNKRYEEVKNLGFCVIHQSEMIKERTYPKSGRYRARVWIENFLEDKKMEDIKRVTYRVWDDFHEKTFVTSARSNDFDLWLTLYGEFPISALIELKTEENIIIERYIDLPGRPPD